jgi:hypothetical protein
VNRSIFGQNGQVIKRIDDEESEDSDEGAPPKRSKLSSVGRSTDILTTDVKPAIVKVPEKEKSVGMFSVNKKNLVLVKPKPKPEIKAEVVIKKEPEVVPLVGGPLTNTTSKPSTAGSLSLLGAYSSDSESAGSDAE